MYNIDFRNIASLLLPPFLRKVKTKDWLFSLLKPLIDIYELFIAFRLLTIQKLSFTGQVIYLEKLLNDKYDEDDRGIFISEGTDMEYVYVGNVTENQPVFIGNKAEYTLDDNDVYVDIYDASNAIYIGNKAEFYVQDDFIVNVPQAIYDELVSGHILDGMKALINLYKLAGKNYTIIPY